MSEWSRRYCLLGLAWISERMNGRYFCKLPALTLPVQMQVEEREEQTGQLDMFSEHKKIEKSVWHIM